MIHFPILRTRRIVVQLRELTIGQAIALAKMPEHLEQAETTAFLRYAVESCEGVSPDPSSWTVQERTLVLCHYLAATSEAGPDFAVGKTGRYSDYFDGALDSNEETGISIGEIGGDEWELFDLKGRDAEVIETLQGELEDGKGNPVTGRAFWILGAMAAQLRRKGEGKMDDSPSGEYEKFLFDRMKVFAAFPERDFIKLMLLFTNQRKRLNHYFEFDFSDTGIVFLPKEAAEDKNLPPARFPVGSCIESRTLELLGLFV